VVPIATPISRLVCPSQTRHATGLHAGSDGCGVALELKICDFTLANTRLSLMIVLRCPNLLCGGNYWRRQLRSTTSPTHTSTSMSTCGHSKDCKMKKKGRYFRACGCRFWLERCATTWAPDSHSSQHPRLEGRGPEGDAIWRKAPASIRSYRRTEPRCLPCARRLNLHSTIRRRAFLQIASLLVAASQVSGAGECESGCPRCRNTRVRFSSQSGHRSRRK